MLPTNQPKKIYTALYKRESEVEKKIVLQYFLLVDTNRKINGLIHSWKIIFKLAQIWHGNFSDTTHSIVRESKFQMTDV